MPRHSLQALLLARWDFLVNKHQVEPLAVARIASLRNELRPVAFFRLPDLEAGIECGRFVFLPNHDPFTTKRRTVHLAC